MKTNKVAAVWKSILAVFLFSSPVLFLTEETNTEINANNSTIYEISDVAFAPGKDAAHKNFAWYTPSTDQPGFIQYAEAGNEKSELFPKGQTTTIKAIMEEADSGESIHEARMSNLKENTTYHYRFGDGNGNWSKTYTFNTSESDDFNFLLFGDPQIGSDELSTDRPQWNNTLETALETFPETDFLISIGDQVNEADNEKDYEAYFSPDELTEYPIQTTIGNHDDSKNYDAHFNVPNESELGETEAGGNSYYTYNNALFIVLNSNNENNEEHAQFIEETIDEHPDVKWRFVVMHHSIYSEARHKYDEGNVLRREELVPVFDDNDIDAVLAGHDHSYTRTYQMEANESLTDQDADEDGIVENPEGVLYLTVNSSTGSKYYELVDDAAFYTNVRSQSHTPSYTNVEITEDSASFTTYNVETEEVIDEYEITKK